MQILVNQKALEFVLEQEESVGEVVDGLAHWLGSGRMTITSLDLDNRSYPIHDREPWQHIGVDDVELLAVEAVPAHRAERDSVEAIGEYCRLLEQAIERSEDEAFRELCAEIPHVRNRLHQIPDGAQIADLLITGGLEDGEPPQGEDSSRLLARLKSARLLVAARLREYDDPQREIAICLGRLHATAGSLADVPLDLHSGRDGEAMRKIDLAAELLSALVRLLPIAEADGADIDTGSIRRVAIELTPHLASLEEALRAHDTVMIGDLLEYEVAPRLQDLTNLLPTEGSVG